MNGVPRSGRQLRLFALSNPLVDRFGPEFFRAAPKTPGVYTMRGEGDRILYIGQSKNLRARLASYKNARPGEAPRKIIRLIHAVRRLDWEGCATAEEAIQLETHLIRKHRPRFNVAKIWPDTWFHIGLRREPDQLVLRWTTEINATPNCDETWHGAYQGRVMGRKCFRALVRLLWACQYRPLSAFSFPHRFHQPMHQWGFIREAWPEHSSFTKSLETLLAEFLDGRDPTLIDQFQTLLLPSPKEAPTLLEQMYLLDLERLREFFVHGPARVHAFLQSSRAPGRLASPWQLDATADPKPNDWFRPRKATPVDQAEWGWDLGTEWKYYEVPTD